jgi:uncharacterized membrane protein YbhN (UPF0104 family)
MKISLPALLLKLLLSALLIAFLVGKMDLPATLARAGSASTGPLVAAVALLMVNVALVGLRWWLLLRRLGVTGMGLGSAFAATYSSVFLGQFLPGNLGADAVRGWLAFARGGQPGLVIASLLADRFLAVVSLLLVSGCGLVLASGMLAADILVQIAISAGVMTVLAAASLGIAPPLLDWLARHLRWLGKPARLARALQGAVLSPQGALGLLLSDMIHIVTSLAVYLLAHGLGVVVSGIGLIVAVPIAILVAALPISMAGWGVREVSLAYGLTLYGASAADSALVSLAFGIALLAAALPGAVPAAMLRVARVRPSMV